MLLATTKFSDFGTRFKLFVGMDLTCGILCCRVDLDMVFSVPQKAPTPNSELSAPSLVFKAVQGRVTEDAIGYVLHILPG